MRCALMNADALRAFMCFLSVLELEASGGGCSQKLKCLSCVLLDVTTLNIILPEFVRPAFILL